MVQFHGVTHVTNHVLLTVAIDVSLELHVTDGSSIAHSGDTVAVNCSVCHAEDNIIECLSKYTPEIWIGASLK